MIIYSNIWVVEGANMVMFYYYLNASRIPPGRPVWLASPCGKALASYLCSKSVPGSDSWNLREALESLSMASRDIVERILVPLGLRGACWAGGGRLGGHGVQKPNVSHRFGSMCIPQMRPSRLQNGPHSTQDDRKMDPRWPREAPR